MRRYYIIITITSKAIRLNEVKIKMPFIDKNRTKYLLISINLVSVIY